MNTKLVSVLCAGFILLAGCQPATLEPVPQAVEPTLSIATSSPTTAPSSIPTTLPPTGTAASSPTSTAQEPVNITAFCTIIGKDIQTYVTPGTPVTLTWGWSATSEKLIDDFLHNHLTEITFDGKLIEGKRVEGIQKNQTSGEPEVVWYADVGVLELGKHIVTYDIKFKQMIEDGHATYGPGGKFESFHDQCEIIVEESSAALPINSPTLGIGSEVTRPLDGMVMLYVPAGPFRMGSEAYDVEKPVHEVALALFAFFAFQMRQDPPLAGRGIASRLPG